MKFLMLLAALTLFTPAASAKVCFACKDKKPAPYVCADRDTFTARRNARKLGCRITSYSSSCNCGATVNSKFVRGGSAPSLETAIWRSLLSHFSVR